MSQPSWIDQALDSRNQIKSLNAQGGKSAANKAKEPDLERTSSFIKLAPQGESQFYAIVVNPAHSNIPGSSNYFVFLTK